MLADAIIALILTIIIGGAAGWLIIAIAFLIGAGFAATDHEGPALVSIAGGWILGAIVWLTAVVLTIIRIIDLVHVATGGA